MAGRRWASREAAAVCWAAGMGDPVAGMQRLAADLIDEIGFAGPPFDPRILASFRNVRDVRAVPMAGAARLVPWGDALVIEVNESHSPGKQNFSADHEVGHTLVPTYAGGRVDDAETGAFPGNREEEFLCDVGAAALLLDPRWLGPLTADAGPSLATLQRLAALFGASLQATARQLAAVVPWPCAFVVWEEGYRKDERVGPGQALLAGFEDLGGPRPKLRVACCYPSAAFEHFVPPNKSVPETSLVATCCEAEPVTSGVERFDLGTSTGVVELHCENLYAPYRRGELVQRRVVSFLLAAGRGEGTQDVVAYQLEAL